MPGSTWYNNICQSPTNSFTPTDLLTCVPCKVLTSGFTLVPQHSSETCKYSSMTKHTKQLCVWLDATPRHILVVDWTPLSSLVLFLFDLHAHHSCLSCHLCQLFVFELPLWLVQPRQGELTETLFCQRKSSSRSPSRW